MLILPHYKNCTTFIERFFWGLIETQSDKMKCESIFYIHINDRLIFFQQSRATTYKPGHLASLILSPISLNLSCENNFLFVGDAIPKAIFSLQKEAEGIIGPVTFSQFKKPSENTSETNEQIRRLIRDIQNNDLENVPEEIRSIDFEALQATNILITDEYTPIFFGSIENGTMHPKSLSDLYQPRSQSIVIELSLNGDLKCQPNTYKLSFK